MSPQLKAAAQRLLAEIVDSFEKLELVVQLHRVRAEPHTTNELAQAISLTQDLVAGGLSALLGAGVVRRDGKHKWILDSDGEWANHVDALVHAYEEDRLLVMDAMTRLALQRIRGQAAQVFADAFLLRHPKKRKPDG